MLNQVERSAYLKAPRTIVYGVLRSYRKYSRWVPDITESTIFATEGEVSVAQFRSPPFGEGKLVVEFIESPESSILFRQIDRLSGGITGRFDLEEAGDDAVVVRAAMSAGTGIRGLLGRRRLRRVLDRTLDGLRGESLRLVAAGATGELEAQIEVLDLRRDGDSLALELCGEGFTLLAKGSEGSGE